MKEGSLNQLLVISDQECGFLELELHGAFFKKIEKHNLKFQKIREKISM
jgi:hypothetical protein